MLLTITLVAGGIAAGWAAKHFSIARRGKKPITPEQARLPTPEGVKRIKYLTSWLNKNLALANDNKFIGNFNGDMDTEKVLVEVIKAFEAQGWQITRDKKNPKVITFSEKPSVRVEVSKETKDKDLEEGMEEVEKLLKHENSQGK